MATIIFLLGTAREGRRSEKVAQFVLDCAKARRDIQPVFFDVANYPQTKTEGLSERQAAEWKAALVKAQGLVIITPEYNHGYPGELKMFLDNAYKEYADKPVAICAVSNGPVGGARGSEQLKLVLSAFQMVVINRAVYFANVEALFDAAGAIKDDKAWRKKVDGMLDEVVKHAPAN